MRTAQQFGSGAMLAFLWLGATFVSADDVLTMRSGKTMRGKLLSYTNGALILEDMDRNIITGKMSAVATIQFDAPPLPLKSEVSPNMEGVTIEQLNIFPEKYVGGHFTYTHCEVSHEVDKVLDGKYYQLTVTSPGGKIVHLHPGDDRIAFVVSPKMAEEMAPSFSGGYHWTDCSLKGDIIAIGDEENGRKYIALVRGLDVVNKGGSVSQSFRDVVE